MILTLIGKPALGESIRVGVRCGLETPEGFLVKGLKLYSCGLIHSLLWI